MIFIKKNFVVFFFEITFFLFDGRLLIREEKNEYIHFLQGHQL